MITWARTRTPTQHMYFCAHCGHLTTSMNRLAGTRIQAARTVHVSAYDCARCGGQTCFDGDRQIPSPSPQSESVPTLHPGARARSNQLPATSR
jgi:DNA-directed RNA polymerase subunit RPC12/RpoP